MPKDKPFYGWTIVLAFFIVGTTLAGINLSFGVFFKSIASEFDLTRGITSLVLSTSMGFSCILRAIGGWAVDRYGPGKVVLFMGTVTGISLFLTSQTNAFWQLFFTYSFLLAVGTSAYYSVTMSTISRWFNKKRGLASGIASAGPGLGIVIMAPFATFLISNLTWRTAYLVMGMLAWLIVIPISRLLKRNPAEIGAVPDGTKQDTTSTRPALSAQPAGLSLLQALRTRSFWLFVLLWISFACGLQLIETHIVPHAIDIGFSAAEAATVLSAIGLAIIAGRVGMGALSDAIGKKPSLLLCSLIGSVALASLIWARDLWALYLIALGYGFAAGGFSPNMATLISDTFGLSRIGTIIGVLDIGFGLGAAVGPILGGFIFDVTNSYAVAFLVGALAMLLTVPLAIMVRRETAVAYALQTDMFP